MAWKTRIRNHSTIVKYHPEDPYAQSKTEAQWNKEKRVVTGPGEVMIINSNYSTKATYYLPEVTRPATPEELAVIREKKKEQRAAKKAAQEAAERAALEAEERRKNDLIARLRRFVGFDPRDIICLDTETTGLGYNDEILQLSIIDGRGEVMFNEFVRPTHVTEWESAQQVHGISPEMVADKPDIDAHLPRINEIIGSAKLMVGYNLDFDLDFIRRAGINIPSGMHYFDVMYMFAEIYGEWSDYHHSYRWQPLAFCAEYYKYTSTGSFHDSMEDTRATLFCFWEMIRGNNGII